VQILFLEKRLPEKVKECQGYRGGKKQDDNDENEKSLLAFEKLVHTLSADESKSFIF
jgi:hypothetical protein